MGCGWSETQRRDSYTPARQYPDEHYVKVAATPGGTVTRTRGYAIDKALASSTPGGSFVSPESRRDYTKDPLSFGEVMAVEQARERARYLAGTPLALRKPWSKIILQTPTASSARSDGGEGGERELHIQLPPEASAGDGFVVETPRGTLVDVVVPEGISTNSGKVLTVAYFSGPRGGTPPTPAESDVVTLLSPPDLSSRRRGRDRPAAGASAAVGPGVES